MKKILLALGLILSPMNAMANSAGVEFNVGLRCEPGNLLIKDNVATRGMQKYTEITEQTQIELIIDVITSYKFNDVVGQIYPNVEVKKIGIMESPAGTLVVVFADKDNCVWSFYNFSDEDKNIFFNEIAKRGA
jgi:hypothetical protein